MTTDDANPSKPVAELVRPQITQLPEINLWRRVWRWFLRVLARVLTWLLIRVQIEGMQNFPAEGGVLVVSNHLGDADFVVGIAVAPRPLEVIVKSELYDFPLLGALLRAYGVIWIHRGRPDRRALRVSIDALTKGRALGISPEGRESLTGALEEGTQGAAYLALKTNVPILPSTFTGTENATLIRNIRRFRRTPVTITIGPPFHLETYSDLKTSVSHGIQKIMHVLANQLPPEYRGVYEHDVENLDEPR